MYLKELQGVSSVLSLLAELSRQRKIVRIDSVEVDREVSSVKAIISSKGFDDPHLVALVRITKCKLVCLRDRKAHKYILDKKLYSSPIDVPKLYSRSSHTGLLKTKNISKCCR